MKKLNTLTYTILTLLTFSACTVGLGPAVDTTPPVVTITSPASNEALSSANGDSETGFVNFEGTFSDDKAIKSINLTIYSRDKASAEKTKVGETVKLTFDNNISPNVANSGSITSNSNKKEGIWTYKLDTTSLPDGSYTLVATGYDGAYTSSEAERNFDVDNTAPLCLLTKPNGTNIESPYKYGSALVLNGEIGDAHDIESISLQFYTTDGNLITFSGLLDEEGNVLEDTDILTYKDIEVAGGTSITIAYDNDGSSYNDKNLNTVYNTLYSSAAPDEKGNVPFYMYVQIKDEAGNESKGTWLKEEVSKELESKSISESVNVSKLYSVLDGSYDGAYESGYLSVLNSTKTGLENDSLSFAEKKLYALSVNKSINPSYTFGSVFIVDDSTADSEWQPVNNQGTMTITVEAGLNGAGVIPDSISIYIWSTEDSNGDGYLEKVSGSALKTITKNQIYNGTQSIAGISTTVSSATYSFTLPDLPTGYYFISAQGYDEAEESFAQNTSFGFHVDQDAVVPVINSVAAYIDSNELSESAMKSNAQNNAEVLSASQTVGGTEKQQMVLKVAADASSGSLSVTAKLADTSWNLALKNGFYYSDVIDFSSITTGTYSLVIIASVTANETTTTVSTQKTFYINNSGPIVNISSPEKGDTTNHTSEISFIGSSYSTYSTPEKIDYLVINNTIKNESAYSSGNDVQKKALFKKYAANNLNEGSASSWKFTLTPFDNTNASSYSSITHTDEGVYTLPVWFLAADDLGNETLISDYTIFYDPNADRPVAVVVYPTDGSSVSGSIRVSGTASDNYSVSAVYFQIDSTANDGHDFGSADAESLAALTDESGNPIFDIVYEEDLPVGGDYSAIQGGETWWGIKASGVKPASTTGWYYTINAKEELKELTDAIIAGGSNYRFKIRAASLDNNNTLGLWSDYVTMEIDPNAPQVSVDGVYQYTDTTFETATASKTYTNGMSLKGDWYLTLTTYDNNGIYAGEMYYYMADSLSGLSTAAKSTVTYKEAYENGDYRGYKVYIPLETGNANTEGTRYIRFYTSDNESDGEDINHTQIYKDYVFDYDNNAPEQQSNSSSYLADVSGTDDNIYPLQREKLKVSNSVISFRGYVNDGGSGFDKALFYFRRVVDGVTTIELPLPETSGSGYVSDSAAAVVYTVSNSKVSISNGGAVSSLVSKDSDSGLYGVTLTGAARGTETFTHSAVSEYKYIRAGGLAYIAGSYHIIASVNGDVVTFTDEVNSSAAGSDSAFFPVALVAGNSLNEVSYWSGGLYYISNDDGDGIYEYSAAGNQTGTWRWQVSVFGAELEDGPVYIDTMIMDKAENCSAVKTTAVMLANHTPRISKVYVGVDINEDGTIENSELGTSVIGGTTQVPYYLVTSNSAAQNVVTLSSTNLKMTGDLALAIEMLGDQTYGGYGAGNGTLYYNAALSQTALTKPSVSSNMSAFGSNSNLVFSDDGVESLNKIYFMKDSVSSEDGDYYINISIADSTPGIALGAADVSETKQKSGITYYSTYGSQATAVNIPVNVDLIDEVTPVSVINPVYWNSAEDNSIYENNVQNGHIEIPSDLPSTYFASNKTGIYDLDPKVSGKISLSGTVFDDHTLDSIWICIDDKTPTGYLTSATNAGYGSNGKVTYKIDGKNYTFYQMAHYTSSGWVNAAATIDANGLAFTVDASDENSYFGQSGHKVVWKLDFDTSTIASVAKADIKIRLLTVDHSGNENSFVINTDSGDGTYNLPYYQMDVVPYITSLTTSLSSKNKKNPSVNGRSALGAYPVYYHTSKTDGSSALEEIIVNGFNLKDGAEVTMQGSGDNPPSASLSGGKFTLSAEATSGEINLSVNGISNLNNINNNFATGSYEGTIDDSSDYEDKVEYAYNLQPNNINNKYLTDDIKLAVIQINSQAATGTEGPIENPRMRISPNGGKLGFSFASGNGKFFMPKNSETSFTYWGKDNDKYNAVEFIYDESGYTYGVAAGRDTGASGGTASKFRYHAGRWGVSTGGDAKSNVKSRRLEHQGYKEEGLEVYHVNAYRIFSPSLAVTRGASNSHSPNVYLAYYDAITNEIRFRAGNISNETTVGNFGQFVDEATDSKVQSAYNYSYLSVLSDGIYGSHGKDEAKPGKCVEIGVIPGTNTTNVSTTKYLANDAGKGVSTTDVVVAVWFDSVNKSVWYSYNTNPFGKDCLYKAGEEDKSDPMMNSAWSTPVAILDGTAGGYCSLFVDANNDVHIAAYSTENSGSVIYTYLDGYNYLDSGDLSSVQCIVDSNGLIGKYISIDVALNSAESKKPVPYIGYYSNDASAPKVAYLVDVNNLLAGGADEEGMFTRKWECYAIPTQSEVMRDKICVAVNKNGGVITNTQSGTNSASNVYANGTINPVLGYGVNNGTRGYMEIAQQK